MENKELVLKINDKKLVLTSNTPDMNKIIEFIVDNKNDIHIDDVSVEVDDDKFDKKGFEEMIKGVISDYLESLKLQKEQLDSIIEDLTNNH